MPPPLLVSQSCVSAPGLVTPSIHLYPDDDPTCVEKPLGTAAEVSGNYCTAPFRDGLPTPPSDMTGVAYNAIPPTNYGGKLNRASLDPYSSNARSGLDPLPTAMAPSVKAESNPGFTANSLVSGSVNQKAASSSSVAPCPQIPSSIKNGKGNLAEFAAQMTCLFWFESSSKLTAIESARNSYASLGPDAIPTGGFQKWVSSVLSTTQVGQNVILLALLFIYRLKKFNPGVKGKRGSEFRLMTIALMLGNKFLDDNTYTNKTWAEVSGISVQEIHIMEVEFLSNVRYNLFASEAEWSRWNTMLGCFADYYRASMIQNQLPPNTPAVRNSPSLGPALRVQSSSPLSKLPSPPMPNPVRSQPTFDFQFNGSSVPQPQFDQVPVMKSRKRSHDELSEERPAKRPAVSNNVPMSISGLPPTSAVTSIPTLPPVLAPTSAPSDGSMSLGSRLPYPNFQTSSNTLAPSIPASVPQTPIPGRGIPVYNSASTWAPPIPSSTPVPPVPNGLYNNSMSLPNPARHQSPLGMSRAVSPALSGYSVHTPQTHLSPSFFLANRYSPYRPVRAVNTLLVPPPSGSMQQQRSVPFDHMHYQPLGKPAAERRTGLLPYAQREPWAHAPFVQPVFQASHGYSG